MVAMRQMEIQESRHNEEIRHGKGDEYACQA